jgi:hypothetical protein
MKYPNDAKANKYAKTNLIEVLSFACKRKE